MSTPAQPATSRVVPLSVPLMRQYVRALRRSVDQHGPETPPGRRVFGIRSEAGWGGPSHVDVDGVGVDVVATVSALHVREVLASRETEASELVLITNLDESQLGLDVMARLARRRLVALDPWTLVLEAFRARDLDPRLLQHRWLALHLLEAMPADGYSPVRAGVLDSQTAWGALLGARLNLHVATPDVVALIDWAREPPHGERVRTLPADVREGIASWLTQSAGVVAASVLAVAERDAGDVVPIGLVCDVLSAAGGVPGQTRIRPDAVEAAIRLEGLVARRPIEPTLARQWADASLVLLRRARRNDPRSARTWQERAHALLRQLSAEHLLRHSDELPQAFDVRAEDAALAVVGALGLRDATADATARAAIDALRRHRLSAEPTAGERVARLEMALRLVHWLRDTGAAPSSLADATWRHVEDGAFADWAATVLRTADPSPVVTDACARVHDAVRHARGQRQQAFAALLAQSVALDADPGVLTVERVLADRVSKLAAHAPVLVVVMDGMSVGVAYELAESLELHDWVLVGAGVTPEGSPSAVEPVLSLLPSVTSISRTSLLSGRRATGAAANESSGFSTHTGLVAHSDPAYPPVLFHKGDLTDANGALSPAVRDAVAAKRQQVVGAIVNAVDDHLLKADQVRSRWRLADLPILDALLHAAREAGRIVVLVADHGHVLDDTRGKRAGGTADRWRPATSAAAVGEVAVRGPRVLAEGNECVLAVSEEVRYQTKKNGYHGGGSPQEVVAPLLALAPAEVSLPGWQEAAVRWPRWWDVSFEALTTTADMVHSTVEVREPKPRTSKPLFAVIDGGDAHEARVSDREPRSVEHHDSLQARLVASALYHAQKAQQVRGALDDERARDLVGVLLARGGRATRTALAAMLGIPALRLRGQVVALKGLLNVENYPVLEIDEASDTVILNRELLETQFDLRSAR